MITPTIGRIVWYFDDATQEKPYAAIVTEVFDDRTVALTIFQPGFGGVPRLAVTLLQEGDEKPLQECYCTWMPYQVAQSKK